MRPAGIPPDEEQPFARALLLSLQLVAMALCALVIMNMLIESSLSAPRDVCVVEPNLAPSQ